MRHWTCVPLAILVCAASASAANSQTLDPIAKADAAAHSICDALKEVRGKKTETQLKAEVEAKVGGVLGKVVDVGGKGQGSLNQQEFDGLTQEATATVLQRSVDCRERIFTLLVNKMSAVAPPEPTPTIPREPRPHQSLLQQSLPLTDFSCDQLWFGRNSIFKEAGYCFKTVRALSAFGNAGCKYDDVRLSSENEALVSAIKRAEKLKACKQ